MADLAAEVRDLAAQWKTQALELKANPDPGHPDHTRASAMESCAAMLADLLREHTSGAAGFTAAAEGEVT